jgi:hypothetical protein
VTIICEHTARYLSANSAILIPRTSGTLPKPFSIAATHLVQLIPEIAKVARIPTAAEDPVSVSMSEPWVYRAAAGVSGSSRRDEGLDSSEPVARSNPSASRTRLKTCGEGMGSG